MKKLLWSVVVIVVLVVGALIAIPYFVDANKYKPAIIDTAKRFTGRDLTIDGDISLSLFPDISLEVSKVTLSNLPEAKEKNMASISRLHLQVALMPLLQGGQINVTKFELVAPEIYLLVTKAGVKNWAFPLAKTAKQAAPNQEAANTTKTLPNAIKMIHDVSIQNGTLHYVDEQKNSSVTLTKVNTTLNLSGPNDPLVFSGSADWNGVNTTTEIKVDRIQQAFNKEGSKIAVQASSELLFATYKGTLSASDNPTSSGDFEVRTSDLNALTAWAGSKPTEKAPKQAFSAKGKAGFKDKKLHIAGLEIELDNNTATGDLVVNTAGDIPFIQGKINAGDINLEPLFTDEKAKGQAAGGEDTPSDWSSEPIKLDGLRSVNADIELKAKSLSMPKLHLGQMDSKINLKGGKLNLTLNNIGFYDGTADGTVVVDASGNTPVIKPNVTLTNVNAEKLLQDTSNFKKLSGRLNGTVNVTAAGKSQKAMVSNLNGTGKLSVTEGKMRGVDLFSMVKNVAIAFKNPGSSTTQETEFSSMTGSMVITNGIVKNNDLLIKAPVLSMQGEGTADLPRKYLDYRLSPILAGSGGQQLTGTLVPIAVKGPFSRLTFTPDVGSVIKKVLENPAGAKDELKSLEKGIKSLGESLGF